MEMEQNGIEEKEPEQPKAPTKLEEKSSDGEPTKPLIDLVEPPKKEAPKEANNSAAIEQTNSQEPPPITVQNNEPHQPSEQCVDKVIEATIKPAPAVPLPTPADQVKLDRKKKEEDKLSIYKALAIKLKKELVKVKEEFQKFQTNKESECLALNERVEELEKTLANQSETSSTTISTLEATLKNLKQQLSNSEQDLFLLQENFENYKNKAQQIMQQSSSSQPQCNKTIEDERLRQLRLLNDDQVKQIVNLGKQLAASEERSKKLELELRQLQEKLVDFQTKLDLLEAQQLNHDSVRKENESLKIALKQFRTKLKEPGSGDMTNSCDDESKHTNNVLYTILNNDKDRNENNSNESLQMNQEFPKVNVTNETNDKPSSPTNSSSYLLSTTGSGSSQLSSKPPTIEIASRSSALEDARNQIDSLTKAYLDSENTNALLSDQVRTLKQEIRRLQLATERIELADNLEYLKNIVLKFLSLDGSQTAQKQRLVPVLSTVLKLNPDETKLLNSSALGLDKNSLASSFFKL